MNPLSLDEHTLGLLNRLGEKNTRRPLSIEVLVNSPGSIGKSPAVEIVQLAEGIDWNAGRLLLHPSRPLTVMTPEQLKEVSKSVSLGQSWHAYQAWKARDAREVQLLERISALESQLLAANRTF